MNIFQIASSIVLKLRYYGIKGIIDFFANIIPASIHRRRLRHYFIQNYTTYQLDPEPGITVIGCLSARGSIYKTLRDFVFSLKESGVAYQTYDICRKPELPLEDIAEILTPESEFRLRRYNRIVTMFSNPLPSELCLDVTVIYFWEYTSAFLDAHPECMSCTSIIGMSDFNVGYFKSVLPPTIAVTKILYPFRLIKPSKDTLEIIRARYGIYEGRFVVFFNFAMSSSCGRKNPDGAMRAFAEAFRNESAALLVFKISGIGGHQKELDGLKSLAISLGIADRFVVISDYLTQNEMYALTMLCDVYLSLHRGEGFGLGIAEAMSLGKPVVVTAWSANLEFCDGKNSLLVPYSIVTVPAENKDHIYMDKLETWAEPDIGFAAKCLRELYKDPFLRERLGSQAMTSIARQFSINNFKRSVEQFVDGVV